MRSSLTARRWNSALNTSSDRASQVSAEAESAGTPEAHQRAADFHLAAASAQLHGRPGVAQEHRRKAAYHQEKAKGSVEPVTKRDPAAPAPTPKPPKVGSLPKPPKPPKPKATQAGVSATSVTMKAEGRHPLYQAALDADADFHKEVVRQFGPKRAGTMRYKSDSHDEKTVAARDKKRAADAAWLAHIEKDRIYKSEPTAILDAARVDAEVERRLAAIEEARRELSKTERRYHLWVRKQKLVGNRYQPDEGFVQITKPDEPLTHSQALTMKGKQSSPQHVLLVEHGQDPHDHATKERNAPSALGKSESDHVKEFVLGLDLGGTRRWHSACVSKDDSNLGKAIKGRQADRTYSREGSRGVPGICTGCGGELQMDPAPREVDAPAHGEDHNEHKIEKAEGKTKMPKYVEGRGWTGGEKDRLYHLTDKRTGQKWVKDVGNMRGVGPEVEVRHATRAEAEEMHQKPLHPGWKVSESVEKGYDDETSKDWVKGHMAQLQQRADEHQKAGRKQDADALRAKIKTIKEKHGMGPAPMDLSKGFTPSQKNAIQLSGMAQAFSNDAVKTGERKAHEIAAGWHRKAAKAWGEDTDSGQHHAAKAAKHDEAAKGAPIAKSELLAGARHHYARVVRFQQLGKSEDASKSAAMCALYVERLGADPAAVPDEVRNCGPVNLQKASFHLDREVRGLPAKMLPLIKATIPNFGSSLPEEERQRDETPIHGHKALGLKLMNWHSSGSDPIYGTGSTFFAGKPVPKWQVQATLDNISKLHREAQTPAGAERGGWGPADVRELGGIKNHLTRLLKTPKTPVQKALTGAPGDMAPGTAVDGGALQMSEKSDVIGEVGKGGGKTLDIGDGYHVHAHGFDANGNHSVWVSKGAGRARKIQSGQNLPSVHSQRGAGEKKGHLPITKQIAKEIKEYHQKHIEKPTKKSECAPAGSPLEKLNAMIKGASSGASLSKAGQDRGQLNAWGQSQKAPASYHQKAQRAMMADHGLGSGHYDNLRPSFDTAWREGKDPKTAAASIVPEYKKMHGLG